ncbi:response regulator transcription factor [Citreimonas salinaria]|uniref:DNA-binding response regulator, OmpR family, contains REC and winged-helix (WHTH) domain n=1 Tax=Citreimonas salinaria TaxID=321339 RepID=A0A1H3FHF7_9RHOB|nr:response regulator transcription factor [Citreimonas salinaria]SDX90563.1 DNA-binding response regulator, OmpR family, contains REC and winged-helix (wHTH) domain [Citreimonas salinaria]
MTGRLLIVDDDPDITSALARGLTLRGYLTETENRADRALARLADDGLAAAIVDVMLGADSGIDLVRDARRAGAALPILMLSALSEVEHRTAGLEAGADDYVVKPFSFDELVARLRVQEMRARAHPVARFDTAERTLRCGDRVAVLTEREADLLLLLARNAERPLPRSEIFDTLWAREGSGTENVVDVYIGYLRKKLAGQDFGFAILTQRNKGFRLDGQAPKID